MVRDRVQRNKNIGSKVSENNISISHLKENNE
jgi:hypothetical protein